jgi:hypothetical protein
MHVTFGVIVEKLWGFKDFSQSLGMLFTTANAIKSAKICPKTISLRNFEMPPKIEILVFYLFFKFHV